MQPLNNWFYKPCGMVDDDDGRNGSDGGGSSSLGGAGAGVVAGVVAGAAILAISWSRTSRSFINFCLLTSCVSSQHMWISNCSIDSFMVLLTYSPHVRHPITPNLDAIFNFLNERTIKQFVFCLDDWNKPINDAFERF